MTEFLLGKIGDVKTAMPAQLRDLISNATARNRAALFTPFSYKHDYMRIVTGSVDVS